MELDALDECGWTQCHARIDSIEHRQRPGQQNALQMFLKVFRDSTPSESDDCVWSGNEGEAVIGGVRFMVSVLSRIVLG